MKVEQDYTGPGFSHAAAVFADESQGSLAIRKNLQQIGLAHLVESVAEYEDVCVIVFNDKDGWNAHDSDVP